MPLWVPNLTIGQEQPKLAICDDDTDYITNSDFEDGKSGWTGGTREQDQDGAPYGEYIFKITAETVTATCAVGSSLGSRTFVFCLLAKSSTSSASVYIGDDKFDISDLSGSVFKKRAAVKTFPAYRETTSFDVKIETAGVLYADGIHCYEVDTYSAAMPNPTYENLKTVRELRPESITGFSVTDLVVGWRFYAFLKWVGLSFPEQDIASAIRAAAIVVYWPHSDEEDCALCRPSTSQAVLKYVFDGRLTVDDDSVLLEGLALQYSESILIRGS